MSFIIRICLLVAALAILTIYFGQGFTQTEKPIEPQSSPLQNTLDAAHKAASQMSR
jgi:hypothetical protein